eukprot:g48904.t1
MLLLRRGLRCARCHVHIAASSVVSARRRLSSEPFISDILAAQDVLAGHIAWTPFHHSKVLSAITGAEVWLKFENHQYTASFKERGALNKLESLIPEQKSKGVIAVSAGNHAQGVAHHASRLGIPAVIVMPKFTPHVKVDKTRAAGACIEVVLAGENFDEARTHAFKLVKERDLTLIHPFDDPKVIAGQGTIALEMLKERPDLEALVVPIGGGGMISGMAKAAKAVKPDIQVWGVQCSRFPSMLSALEGKPAVCGTSTLADGIAVKQPGKMTLKMVKKHVDGVVLVEEGDIEAAILMLLEIEKTVVEGAGATGLAALIRHRERFKGKKVGLVLCGGNIDPLTLADVIQKGMVRTSRLTKIVVTMRHLPGSLAAVTWALGELSANIEAVSHQRSFTELSLQDTEVEFVLQTRSKEHVKQIIAHLREKGYSAEVRNNMKGTSVDIGFISANDPSLAVPSA